MEYTLFILAALLCIMVKPVRWAALALLLCAAVYALQAHSQYSIPPENMVAGLAAVFFGSLFALFMASAKPAKKDDK